MSSPGVEVDKETKNKNKIKDTFWFLDQNKWQNRLSLYGILADFGVQLEVQILLIRVYYFDQCKFYL